MDHAQSSPETGHAVPNGVHDAINGDKPAELIVKPDVNGVSQQKLNGAAHTDFSPAADSPATPVSSGPAPDVKIDLDYQEQESDVRNEPMQIKSMDDAFNKPEPQVPVVSQLPLPVDQTSVPSAPQDIKMDDQPTQSNSNDTNDAQPAHTNGDVDMKDDHDYAPPPPLSTDASMATSDRQSPVPYTPRERPGPGEEEDGQPPAKRPRVHSDADKASMTHSATPPPASAAVSNAASPIPPAPPSTAPAHNSVAPAPSTSTAVPRSPGTSTMSLAQWKYCGSCIRSLKKLKDSIPFLKPVDPVQLNIPHYPSIIKHPMDFSTIERKLNSSNPVKPDPNPDNPRYLTVEDFVSDVRLVFTNCLTFNGPDHVVTQMGKRVEQVFDKHLKGMPAAEPKHAPPPKKATPPPPPPVSAPPVVKKAPPPRRPSTSFPAPRRNDVPEPLARPKREIHPPPPKDLPYEHKVNRKPKRVVDESMAEQFKFCSKLLNDLFKKQYYNIAHPFYEPVDWVRMEIPSYPKIIKKPMDMSTMRKKLDNGEYATPQKFAEDFRLMLRNCSTFNPVGTPVCTAGQQLGRVFEEKWKALPPLRPTHVSDDDDDDDDADDSEAERQRAIALMEAQIETMKGNLEALKNAARNKERKKKKKEKKEREPPPPPPPVKAAPKPAKAPKKKSSSSKKAIADDDVLTFEQKKDLSETIGKLEGAKLEKVINIIHEGVPEIRDSTEEIELEIDLLPASVLTKLYNFVIRPLKQPPVKRNRPGKGTGTGGLKRKSMDEDVEAEKIRQLEQRMALFDNPSVSAPPAPLRRADDSDHSSDSSSGSDSSGSDSE
ncbi:bromodomain-containing protein [Coprinopsis cinerea okayama7|uniref:Bromodomain-containing protein n=1 Tax=Coprinopsis cinerea (strain Okayama-7 / 130 / ATCC MYA-4618 / FGSC 9003) TaxID=240176 RepID=D6RJW2_COPC7|nr:bromodomain-containing protein [Coprinopsis cinerea okayama7\|eukprot:XP_002912074.1 bromodomain-containing protein [Coprinopsis cinerea okayama7\